MKAHLIDTHLLVPRSKSSAKVNVNYQGHVSQKRDVSGAFVFHKHILFFSVINFYEIASKDVNPFLHTCICFRKTLWKKVKLLRMSNFTFFHNGFYAIFILKSFNSHSSVVVCSFFEFSTLSKWCIRKWVRSHSVQDSSLQMLSIWKRIHLYCLTHSHIMTPFDASGKQAF